MEALASLRHLAASRQLWSERHALRRAMDGSADLRAAAEKQESAKRYNESILESIPGLGPAKRRQLLKHFGGLQGVLRAGIADFEKVA